MCARGLRTERKVPGNLPTVAILMRTVANYVMFTLAKILGSPPSLRVVMFTCGGEPRDEGNLIRHVIV